MTHTMTMTMTMTTTLSLSTVVVQSLTQAREASAQAAQAARAQADQARAQAEAARNQAREIEEQVRKATEDARDAAQTSVNVQADRNGVRKVITLPDGKGGQHIIEIGSRGVSVDGEFIASTGKPFTIDATNAMPRGVVDIVQAVGTTLVFCIVGLPLARSFARWIDRRGTSPAIPTEVASRLSNIENAVETVAVEVERISEGQRFTTRLLNDRAANANAQPASVGDRAIR